LKKFDEKMKKITDNEKRQVRENKERKNIKEFSRTQKINKIKHNSEIQESQNDQERDHYNQERWQKVEANLENERKMAEISKRKFD
jgi:hypothetical protein